MGEFDYIRWVRERSAAAESVVVGIGDDCAVLRPNPRETLVTTDMLLDGRHFHLAEVGPQRAGRKSLAVNLSDIAAMGGIPRSAVVSLALPRQGTREIAEGVFLGMSRLAEEFGVAIVGGDTNTWDGKFAVSITLIGEAGPHGPVLRSGARPGDWLFITGPLGGSIHGKHLDFTPRIREALWIQEFARIHAMIDVSDGLAADVGHLAEESACGFVLDADAIPISETAQAANDGVLPLHHALGDGEDFELAFCVTPEDGRRLLDQTPPTDARLTRIGTCVAEAGVYLEKDGRREPLPPLGFVHDFDP